MGKERQKAYEEQLAAQQKAFPGASGKELKIGQAYISLGPGWYNGYDDTLNGDVLAGEIIDELELNRKSTGIYNGEDRLITESELIDVIMDKIMPYFPEKAANLARFNVMPALWARLKKKPLKALETASNGMGLYVSGRMQEEIRAFIAASDTKTGFLQFDKLAGGLYPGLYVLGAISSLGKTTFVQQIADNVAAAGKPVLFFSLEMSRLEMASKSISRKTAQIDFDNAVSSLKIRAGVTSRTVQEATEAYINAIGDNMQIIEGGFDTTVDSITEYTRAFIEQHENRKPVVIVDYLQIIQGKQKGTVREAIDYNVVELKRLSRALDVPVIVISSINRGNYLLPIDFESFKESGGIEYTADVVLGMQLACLDDDPIFQKDKDIMAKREAIKAAKAANPRKIRLVCLKNRYGRPDWTITYQYYPQFDYFREEGGYTEVKAPITTRI